MIDHETFELGDFVLQNGATLRGARLVYPTRFGERHPDNEWLIGEGMGLLTDCYRSFVETTAGRWSSMR